MNRTYEEKLLDGFPSKTREAPRKIHEPPIELPEPPDHLNVVTKRLWYQLGTTLVGMCMMTPADWLSLMAICDAYATYLHASEVLEREGMVIEVGKTWPLLANFCVPLSMQSSFRY